MITIKPPSDIMEGGYFCYYDVCPRQSVCHSLLYSSRAQRTHIIAVLTFIPIDLGYKYKIRMIDKHNKEILRSRKDRNITTSCCL